MAEKLFLAFLLRVSGKNRSSSTIFGIERFKVAHSKGNFLAQNRVRAIFDLGPSSRENGAQMGHCRPEKRVFPDIFFSGNQIPNLKEKHIAQTLNACVCQIWSRSVHPFGL